MSFLSLDLSPNDSRLTVFLTEVKIVFHVSILSLVRSGNGYTSGCLSYVQASNYRPCHTYYVTVLVFVCPYVRTTLAVLNALHSFIFLLIPLIFMKAENKDRRECETPLYPLTSSIYDLAPQRNRRKGNYKNS